MKKPFWEIGLECTMIEVLSDKMLTGFKIPAFA
jgi:hypothetical protein